MTNQEANIIIGACTILDVIKSEWGAAWSEWDQSVRDGLSKMLATIYSAREIDETEICEEVTVPDNNGSQSAEPRTQGMSAERFYDSQQKFDFLCNRSHKSIMEFAEAYCEQETARLRAELETEQQDYGRLVKVLEKAEAERDGLREALRKYGRHMPECTSAFIKLPCNCGFEALIAAAPTKETDSPK